MQVRIDAEGNLDQDDLNCQSSMFFQCVRMDQPLGSGGDDSVEQLNDLFLKNSDLGDYLCSPSAQQLYEKDVGWSIGSAAIFYMCVAIFQL